MNKYFPEELQDGFTAGELETFVEDFLYDMQVPYDVEVEDFLRLLVGDLDDDVREDIMLWIEDYALDSDDEEAFQRYDFIYENAANILKILGGHSSITEFVSEQSLREQIIENLRRELYDKSPVWLQNYIFLPELTTALYQIAEDMMKNYDLVDIGGTSFYVVGG